MSVDMFLHFTFSVLIWCVIHCLAHVCHTAWLQEELAGVDPRVSRHRTGAIISRSSSQERDSDVRKLAFKPPRHRGKHAMSTGITGAGDANSRESSDDGSD